MKVKFYYKNVGSIDMSNYNFKGVFSPKENNEKIDLKVQLSLSLQEPIGSESLAKKLAPGKRVLILSDDNTRTTPVREILNQLLPYIESSGVRREDITILMAVGTHRMMKDEEIIKKIGKEIFKNYVVKNHEWNDPNQNTYFGKTSKGIEVWGNKLLKESDVIIGLGHIVPHRVAGFSGGGKIVQPGVSTGITTGQTHWLSALIRGNEIMGKRDNIVRGQIDESAKLMGLDFIINVVQDLEGNVVGLYCGDFIEAHKVGCEKAKDVFGVDIPKADIVLTDSYPADIELWQAAKGIYSSDLVVKDGGVIILVTPCPEGVAVSHPEIEKFGYMSLKEVEKLIQNKELEEMSVAAHLVHVGRVIKEQATGIMVSENISKEIKEKIGFMHAESVEDALNLAIKIKGSDASIVAMLHAGEILPIVKN
jgi:nickel-dependent lactate racemase